ncbi:MAG: protein YgfX [Thiotrichaceae bacterium]
MSDSSFDKPLVIRPVSSLSIKLIVFLSHVLVALFVITLLDVNLAVSFLLVGLIALSFAYYYRWYISKSLDKSVLSAVHQFQKNKKTTWAIDTLKRKDLAVELLSSSFVNPRWVILNFKDQSRHHYTLMVPCDAVSSEVHRQLRVRLKVLS